MKSCSSSESKSICSSASWYSSTATKGHETTSPVFELVYDPPEETVPYNAIIFPS